MEYTTDFTDKDLLNSNGCQVEYYFEDIKKRGVGILTVENGKVYVCQNDFDGKECFDRKEFKYSYVLNLTEPSNSSYYKKVIQKLYKPKSLVGRYLKALVDNAQGSKVIKNNFYKIVFENPDSIEFYTEFFPEMALRLDKENEGVFFELMPEGFEPNQNPTVLGVELVKGEYYVIKCFFEWMLKTDRIEDGKIYFLVGICEDGDFISNGYLTINSIQSISKANFSERLWLDKCIAAGKFIPKEEALEEDKHEIKFKIIDGLDPMFVIPNNNNNLVDIINKKSYLEFQEPVIIKSIKNKPKLIIINN